MFVKPVRTGHVLCNMCYSKLLYFLYCHN